MENLYGHLSTLNLNKSLDSNQMKIMEPTYSFSDDCTFQIRLLDRQDTTYTIAEEIAVTNVSDLIV